jgi:hypothetical protein
MNPDQIKQPLAVVVGIIGGWLVGSKKLTEDQWGQIANLILQYGPGLIGAAAAAWVAWRNRPKGQMAAVAAMPDATKAAALASLPEDQQARIATALPDKAVVAAAGAMGGGEVKVHDSAPAGAQEAAADPAVPGVNPA